MLRFNPDFRAWAKQRRERPVHANPLGGREVVGAALNRLLRLSFALVKNQTYYRSPQISAGDRLGGIYHTSGGQGDTV